MRLHNTLLLLLKLLTSLFLLYTSHLLMVGITSMYVV